MRRVTLKHAASMKSRKSSTPSRERVHGPVASSHAGGMPAISRRLSVATPPEASRKHNASQRDASARWVRHRRFGSLAGIPSGGGSFWTYSGGVAALNHRLTAAMPPASEPATA